MTTRFTMDVARALLDKLATDDAFRARFESDARAALRELGHETPTADQGVHGRDPVMHLQSFRGGLASKEKIAANTDSMLATFAQPDNAQLAFFPFSICAG